MLFTWHHFRMENQFLRKKLKVREGETIDLTFKDGVFIAFDDTKNRASNLPRVLLPKTKVDIFESRHSELYGAVKDFFEQTGGFDRHDYGKFIRSARFVYFFACMGKTLKDGFLDGTNINFFYKGNRARRTLEHIRPYSMIFLEHARESRVDMTLFSLFPFAVKHFESHGIDIHPDFASVARFTKSNRFNPFKDHIGKGFEAEIQSILETQEPGDVLIEASRYFGSPGFFVPLIVPIDEDDSFKRISSRAQNVERFKVPDYLYITRVHIMPVDLKANLRTANIEQISARNLEILFKHCKEALNVIFDGITINGTLYSSS